jgi:hypothetical protein
VIERYGLNTVVLSPLVPVDTRYMPLFTHPGLRAVEHPPAVVVRVRP